VRSPQALVGFGVASLALVTNGRELMTGLRTARRRGTKGRLLRARRRYGGLVVHVGLAVLALGIIASSGFAEAREVTLSTGEGVTFAGQRLRYQGLTTTEEPHRTVLTARIRVSGAPRAGAETLDPRLNLYPAASEPIGSPAIDRGLVWDTYASVIALQDNGGSATFRVYRTPGVNWLWLGALLMVLGGIGAVWPTRRRARATVPGAEPSPEPVPSAVGAH
jgi:cytochrome c-type biogenesis protein CcmF